VAGALGVAMRWSWAVLPVDDWPVAGGQGVLLGAA